MNDRESLELAAKAADVDLTFENDGFTTCHWKNDTESLGPWNPLNDDGDALRLAVKIGLVIEIGCAARGFSVVRTNTDNWKEYREAWGSDPCAATRRAIVRAAAEIGRSK